MFDKIGFCKINLFYDKSEVKINQMSEVNINEIHALAASSQPDITSPLYIGFTTDPNFVPTCLEILKSCFGRDSTTFFVSTCLYRLTQGFISQWSPEFIAQVKADIIAFFRGAAEYEPSDAKRFNLAIDNCAKVYSIILNKNYTTTNVLDDINTEIHGAFSIDTPRAIFVQYRVYCGVFDFFKDFVDLRSNIKAQISDNKSFQLFMMALSVIKDKVVCAGVSQGAELIEQRPIPDEVLTPEVIDSCLNVMKKALEFDMIDISAKAVQKDEVLSEQVAVKPLWREIVTSPELHEFLFSVGMSGQNEHLEIVLEIIYLLSSVKRAMYMQAEQQAAVFSLIINKVGEIIGAVSEPRIIFQISKILFKVRYRTENNIVNEVEGYDEFLALLSEKTQEYINNNWILNNTNTMIYLMKFWGICKVDKTPFAEIFSHFVEEFIQIPEKDVEDRNSIFDLETGRVSDVIRVVPLYAHEILVQFLPQIIEHLNALFAQYIELIGKEEFTREEDMLVNILDRKCSIIILFLTTIIKRLIKVPDEAQLESMRTLMTIMEASQEAAENIYGSGKTQIVRSLLVFCKQFTSTNFVSMVDNNCALFGEDFFFTNIVSACDCLLAYISGPLQAFTDDKTTISLAVTSLEKIVLFMNDNAIKNKKLLSLSQFAPQLLKGFCDKPFDFMVGEENDQETRIASKSLTLIALSNVQSIEFFQEFLNSNYELFKSNKEPNVFVALINNFIGTFKACTTKQTFDIFFTWLFPEKLEELIDYISKSELTDFTLLSKYFKFLYSTIMPQSKPPQKKVYSDKPEEKKECIKIQQSKISFPQHSENGVRLFKALAIALISGFNTVTSVATESSEIKYEDCLDVLKPMFKLMAQIMSAEYVMFEAFEYYEDNTLDSLMKAFFETLSNLDIQGLFQYPKYAPITMNLLLSLAKSHMRLTIKSTGNFADVMLDIIELVLKGSDAKLKAIAMDTAKYIFQFFLDNASNEEEDVHAVIEANLPHLQKIMNLIWAILLNDEDVVVFTVAQILRPALILIPQHIEFLHNMTTPFIQDTAIGEFEENFKGVVCLVENLSSVDETTLNNELIKVHQFATKTSLRITVPSE